MPTAPLYGVEGERSLELPLGYAAPGDQTPRVAIVFHAFHADLVREFRAYLEHIPGPADLFVSTDTEGKQATVETDFAGWTKGAVTVRVVPNRGRDIAPKIVGLASAHDRYEYVLHLHTKKSPHSERLEGWRGYLLETLLGSPEIVRGVFELFARAPRLGLVAPQHIDEIRPWIGWGLNHPGAEALAGRMGFALPRAAPLDFPSGSMFWARTAALRPLLDLHLGFEDFPEESGQTDGTLGHSIERLFFLVCEQAGFDWLKVTARGELHDQSHVSAVSSQQELDRFLARHRLRLASLCGEVRQAGGDAPGFTTLPPKPRRVLHVAWRAVLGEGVPLPPGRRLVVGLHGTAASSDTLVRSVEAGLQLLPAGVEKELLSLPGVSRGEALQACMAVDADLALLIEGPGLLHPGSGEALLRMAEAHGGQAVMQATCVPGSELQGFDGRDFSLPFVAGAAVAIPRAAYEAAGGYDGHLAGGAADREFSQRARANGFVTLLCPRALFHSAASPDAQDAA